MWLQSLVSPDPWLPSSVDATRARALADAVASWVESGRPASGRLGVCLRIHEPEEAQTPAPWTVEVLVADEQDVGMRTPMASWWPDAAGYGAEAGQLLLADLARAIRVAPELSGLLDAGVPEAVEVDDHAVASLLSQRVEPLTELGVAVLLPAWWTGRSRVGLRAKAKTRRSPGGITVTASGFGLDELVDFQWEAALEGEKLTPADLEELAAAAEARRELVRVRGRWVQCAPRMCRPFSRG
jgi:hypothetical protein